MHVLGISAFYHDSAACLVCDGDILAAAQEERFTRKKHDSSFPVRSIEYCLKEGGISLDEVDYITFYEKPLLKFERIIESHLSVAPLGIRSFLVSMPLWIKEKLFQKRIIVKHLQLLSESPKTLSSKVLFAEHHLSHAASAYYPSSFDNAIIITLDGVGEWATTTVGIGQSTKIRLDNEIRFPHSLGLLYSAFTYYLGFKVNSDEYKVMGLAPFGEPQYEDLILNELIDIAEDGSFWLNMKFFGYLTGLRMTNKQFDRLFGQPRRNDGAPLTKFHCDVAASLQKVTETIIVKIVEHARNVYKTDNVCLAGGVALNCVANGRILQAFPGLNLWIQPAAGDAGGALGAALYTAYQKGINRSISARDSMKGSLLGPCYTSSDIEELLKRENAPYKRYADFEELCDTIASEIAAGKVVGWFQGRMEYGPRALGNRSILADPRNPNIQAQLNQKTKFRENFRPFAPSILNDQKHKFFNINCESPYMLLVDWIKEDFRIDTKETPDDIFKWVQQSRSSIPAVTHVDYSARIQTVDSERNPRFYQLLKAFYALTGCPALVNTSFNVNNEPIVCSPGDAYGCFSVSKIDILVLGDCIIRK